MIRPDRKQQIQNHINLTANIKMGYENDTKFVTPSSASWQSLASSSASSPPTKQRVMEHVKRTMG
ncbi:MAG: hypothetical protein ACTS2F_14260 [Thainema sp.]